MKKGMSKRWMEGERYRERDRGEKEWRERQREREVWREGGKEGG